MSLKVLMLAYQGVTLSDEFEDAVAWVQGLHRGWTVVPDMTILFTIDPEIAVSRCGVRGEKTKFEKLEFLKKVQDNFLRLAREEPRRFVIIDAGKELETVGLEVEAKVGEFLNAVHR